MTKADVHCWLGSAFSLRSIFHNAIGAFLSGAVFLTIAEFGQPIESALDPVIAVAPYQASDFFRDEKTACFTMHLSKRHEATILKYEFFAETRLSAKVGLSAYLANPKTRDRLADSDLISHPSGSHWDRTYCSDMPAQINDAQCFRMTGYAQHMRHPFWTSISPVRPLVFPPISGHGDCELR